MRFFRIFTALVCLTFLSGCLAGPFLDIGFGSGGSKRASISGRSSGFAYKRSHGFYIEHRKVSTRCFSPRLRSVLRQIERKFRAPVIVTSGYRSPTHNRRAGGARRSKHMSCEAADIFVHGVRKSKVMAYARKLRGAGGVGCYPGRKFFHIDVRKRAKGLKHRPIFFRGCPRSWSTARR